MRLSIYIEFAYVDLMNFRLDELSVYGVLLNQECMIIQCLRMKYHVPHFEQLLR